MPEFSDFLSGLDKLRLGVQTQQPGTLARMLAQSQYTAFEQADIVRLYHTLRELVLEVHGEAGLSQFDEAFHRRRKR